MPTTRAAKKQKANNGKVVSVPRQPTSASKASLSGEQIQGIGGHKVLQTTALKTKSGAELARSTQVEPSLCALGGVDGSDNPVFVVERLGEGSEKWGKVPSAYMNTQRFGYGATVQDGRLLVVGGVDADSFNNLSTAECFVPEEKRWEALPASLKTPRSECFVIVVAGTLYAVGGWGSNFKALSSVERYNAEKGRWELVAPMRQARAGAAAVVLHEQLYVLGGCSGHRTGDNLKTVERYDADKNSWDEVADMTTERYKYAAAVFKGKLYAIGGVNAQGQRLSSVECYEPTSNEWKQVAPLKRARVGHAAAVWNGRLLVVGGFGVDFSVEGYDLNRNQWVREEVGDLQKEREDFVLAVCSV